MKAQREQILEFIQEAVASGARQHKACQLIGISAKTYQRWIDPDKRDDQRRHAKHAPTNKLTEAERQEIIAIANTPAFGSLSPHQIVPKLADQGIYIASESSFYRILKAQNQLQHRTRSKPANPSKKPRALVATAPNLVYSWDITYLPAQVKGVFYYLYMVMDVFSRKVVGWQVYDCESSAFAAGLMTDICQREQIQLNQVTLHSDNGSPMKGATLLVTLQKLGIMPTYSRPSISNDNPYSEAIFKTLKYSSSYPDKPFSDLGAARKWVASFVSWYNEEHCHSAIRFVTPAQRHDGSDIEILRKRKNIYLQAKKRNPSRWSGNTRNWNRVQEVSLNPDNTTTKSTYTMAA